MYLKGVARDSWPSVTGTKYNNKTWYQYNDGFVDAHGAIGGIYRWEHWAVKMQD